MSALLRRLRGAASNALFWGAAWFGFGVIFHTVTRIFTGGAFVWPYELYNAVYLAGYMGLSGAVVGAGFAAFISANFREQRVEELGPWRFAFGGGLVTALFSLVLMLSLNPWIWPFDLPVLLYTMGFYSVLGGSTAFGTIKLAQRGQELERLEAGEGETARRLAAR